MQSYARVKWTYIREVFHDGIWPLRLIVSLRTWKILKWTDGGKLVIKIWYSLHKMKTNLQQCLSMSIQCEKFFISLLPNNQESRWAQTRLIAVSILAAGTKKNAHLFGVISCRISKAFTAKNVWARNRSSILEATHALNASHILSVFLLALCSQFSELCRN